MSGNFLSCSKGVKDPLEVPEFSGLPPICLSRNGPHLAWRGEPPGFSRVAAGALDLRRGPQGTALVASGKASPHASCSGASRDSSPVDARAKDLVWSRCRNLRIPLQCGHGSWGISGVSPGELVVLVCGGMNVHFPPEL